MHLELAKTLRNYDRKNLSKDILTGLIIMAVSIPISMGYAQIAGLPAVYGLYGSVFPIILFGLFSTSPQFIFGVDAAPAALIGAALVEIGIQSGSEQAMAVVPVLTFFVAVWLFIFAFFKAGKLVTKDVELTLIPYYAWAHRGEGDMEVWLPIDVSATSAQPQEAGQWEDNGFFKN